MDIDKIIARKKRKRLISVKLNATQEWGAYADGKGQNVQTTVKAHDCTYKNLWYLVTKHEKHGAINLLFSPNRTVLDAINKSVPHSLRKQELKEKPKDEGDGNE